jgi:FAD/FMN-containing dehydrogenase/Fe-S oxidoreductase
MGDIGEIDGSGLARRLRRDVSGEVRFDTGSRALYTMDASNYRRVPTGVVLPRTVEDVIATVAVCRAHDVPVVVRGAGTSIAGNATGTGVVIDTSRHLTGILGIDPASRTARVEPGVVLADLQAAAAPYGLRFGPDPSTQTRCTIGGMIGNNACGSHSVAWGTTAANVEELDVLGYDGTRRTVRRLDAVHDSALRQSLSTLVDENLALIRERFFALPRRVSGYSLDWLLPEHGGNIARALTGTEGTCVTVLGATVGLVPAPPATVLLVLGFPDDVTAAEAVPALLEYGPLTVEGLDRRLLEIARTTVPDLPAGGAWLFVEIGGESVAAAADRAATVATALNHREHSVLRDSAAQRAAWRVREDGAGLGTRLPDGSEAWPGWEDAAVPPERLGAYLRDFRGLLRRYGLQGLTYGHFGEGCVHVRIDFDLVSARGVAAFREFVLEAADVVIGHGGSPSGEHGDGLARSELLERMYGTEAVRLFERFKAIWDPADRMNPGVIVRPHPIDGALRFEAMRKGAAPPRTVLAYEHDRGSLPQAARRCVGVGKCVTREGGVMCPSYRATREERHSTRGRAHLLFEMLSGDLITGGWRSEEVREALDLCLACKGCARDCPVTVDMSSYKVEFLHHHYRGRTRPAAHYSMGWLPLWLSLISAVPGAAGGLNATTRQTLLAGLVKRLGGIAPERRLPEIAREPFTTWFRHHAAVRTADRGDDGRSRGLPDPRPGQDRRPTVVLWPDTFTNHFSPEVGRAAVAVLEAAGLRVVLPPSPVCCGLTWYSTGQLKVARTIAARTLDVLRPALDAGLPVVVLEPSCAAFFRTDLTELLPGDETARRLAGATRTFAEILTESFEDRADHQVPDGGTAGAGAPDIAAHGGLGPDDGTATVGGGLSGLFATGTDIRASAIAQVHCHQYAVLGYDADRAAAAAAGIDVEVPDTGCCGLAGDFGFARGHYDVSVACAERALLPAIDAASPATLVLADGFSCRTQIAELSGRRALHLAEVLRERLAVEPSDAVGGGRDVPARDRRVPARGRHRRR